MYNTEKGLSDISGKPFSAKTKKFQFFITS